MFIDTHCHLSMKPFTESDPQSKSNITHEIITNSQNLGVKAILSIGTNLEDSLNNIKLGAKYPNVVYPVVGIHPCNVLKYFDRDNLSNDKTYNKLKNLAQNPSVIAIGETGLDYFHPADEGIDEKFYHEIQKKSFEIHYNLASESKKPLILHSRGNCWDDLFEMLNKFKKNVPIVMHCFSAGIKEAKKIIDLGHFISFTGNITYKSAETIREVVKYIPEDRFMLETDAPYLIPEPIRSIKYKSQDPKNVKILNKSINLTSNKRIKKVSYNQPAYLVKVAEYIANLRKTSLESIAEKTTENAKKFFKIKKI